MPSKVVHIRLDDWVLVGCYDLLKVGGRETANLSSAIVVKEIVRALIKKMQEAGHIKTYEDAETLWARAQEIWGIDVELPVADITPEVFVFDEPSAAAPAPDEEFDDKGYIRGLAIEVQQKIDESQELDIHVGGEVMRAPEEVEEPPPIPSINLFNQERTPITELKKKSPKDRFIEYCATPDADPIQVAAIELVYTNMGVDSWGSEHVAEMIADLVDQHEVL